MIKIIILFSAFLNISRSQEYEVFGFDCSNASFIQNLTLNENIHIEEDIYKREDVRVQIIQEMNEEKVDVHEIKVTRDLFVQQCGGTNWHWSWWHELMIDVEMNRPWKLDQEQIQNLIGRGQITVGQEYGINKIFSISKGEQSLKLETIGLVYYDISDNRYYCKGGFYTDARGVVHPNIVATAIYHVQYHVKKALTKNTQVLLSFDDGNCHLPFGSMSTLCYNIFLGINYYITRNADNQKECKYLPTRKGFLNGEIISTVKTKIFVAEKENIFLKLTKTSDVCDCKHSYLTQYKGLYIRNVQKCSSLTDIDLPPNSLNLEYNNNIKLDYMMYKSENVTKFIYELLQEDLEISNLFWFKKFMTVSRKLPNLGVFEIQKPYFGKLRGEIISVMKCSKSRYKVRTNLSFCTKELQVEDNNGHNLYMAAGTNIIQEQFQKDDCLGEERGIVYEVINKQGFKKFIIQENEIFEINISGNLMQTHSWTNKQLLFNDWLNINSFVDSGIYDEEYLARRNSYIFEGEIYEAIQTGISRSFVKKEDWKAVATDTLDILGLLNHEELILNIFGGSWLLMIDDILKYLSYMSGLHTVYIIIMKRKVFFRWIYRKIFGFNNLHDE